LAIGRSTGVAKKHKWVYYFGGGKAEGKAGMKALLGGKGANLAEMTNLKLPVPPGFTISTEACHAYFTGGSKWPAGLEEQIDANVKKLEKEMKKKFGDPKNTLLVSVRSGAAISMPGMMDTVLNLGLTDEVVEAMIAKTGNERFAWDAYRRLLNMFGDVVMGVDHEKFEHQLTAVKKERGAAQDTDLDADGLKEVVRRYKEVYREGTGSDFPQDPREQLRHAVDAVFSSWNNTRAIKYRAINDIKGLIGTAVNVQTMVFGNMGETSGTGVAFTRDPATGEDIFYGEYLMNAQGEDVVAGIRTPEPISKLEAVDPKSYKQLVAIRDKLEKHYKDMQDVEFTIEEGRLFMLQTRTGKRTAAAAVRMAVEMVGQKLITKDVAVARVAPDSLDQLLHPMFDPQALAGASAIAKGLPASPGAAVGKVVFSADDAEEWKARGEDVILCRVETSPEDVGGMNAAKGILTSRGGMTSHAAVVARGMGKCCVAGAGDIRMDYAAKTLSAGGVTVREGEEISLNGSQGTVYVGRIPTREPELSGGFGTLMGWADEFRKIGVRTNADLPRDAEQAVKFGAEGIGLTRTEHMFFEGDRIISVRKMILAETLEERKAALAKLLPLQRGDFEGIFKAMDGLPVTIRLLDPPLHEFLPHDEAGQQAMASVLGVGPEKVKAKIEDLHEFNPMLGHRGCRLGISYPEITEMQARAIIEAALNVKAAGTDVHPEIMVPLVGIRGELDNQEKLIRAMADKVFEERGAKVDYMVGTMIEIPRAAVTANRIAETAEFFSFGTNDLTQMGCGFSRDDAGKFLSEYVDLGIYEKDPFQVLDQEGVGEFVRIAIERGRSTRPDLKVGICGEHGGEPASVKFCHRVGMDYVSCSPYRVPIARLAAAQAAVEEKAAGKAPAKGAKKATKKKAGKKAKKKAKKKARRR
jgi:pyruvate,orthophosphate dikinase